MTKFLKSTISALLFGFCAMSANAAIITLGTIDKEYGSAIGRGDKASTGGKSCDTLNAASITVRDSDPKSCARFTDTFDFSGMNYKSIDNLKLTLSFSDTNDLNYFLGFIPVAEDWRLIIADSTGKSSNQLLDMTNKKGVSSQTFMINASTHANVFTNISNNGKFQMWFGDEAWGANNFTLRSATLEVTGTAVPEPSSIALFGISMLGVAFARRRKTIK